MKLEKQANVRIVDHARKEAPRGRLVEADLLSACISGLSGLT